MPRGVYTHKKGYKRPQEVVEKIRKANTGYKHSDEAKLKMSVAKTGKSWGKHSEESKKQIGVSNSKALSGQKRPWATGDKSPAWKGGVTPKNMAIRKSLESKNWRKSVFERDNWTCQDCGVRGGILNADHIKPFAYFPDLRLALDNGRTLCKNCHLKTDTYSNRYKKYVQLA